MFLFCFNKLSMVKQCKNWLHVHIIKERKSGMFKFVADEFSDFRVYLKCNKSKRKLYYNKLDTDHLGEDWEGLFDNWRGTEKGTQNQAN